MILVQIQKVCFARSITIYRDISTDDKELYKDLFVGSPRLIPEDLHNLHVNFISAEDDCIFVEVD